jgi:hypothetical protein
MRDRFQITIGDDSIIMRTIDDKDFPNDIWIFKTSELSLQEQVFVSNIISMSMSMINKK